MDHTSELTTEQDPNARRHRPMLMIGIWLGVYPLVTLATYLTADWQAPTFVKTFVTTILTVPVITYLVVPNAKKIIAIADPKADPDRP